MASTDLTTAYLKLWLQSDADSIRRQGAMLASGIDTYAALKSDMHSKMSRAEIATHQKISWQERRASEFAFTGQLTTATLVISGDLLRAAATQYSMMQHIRIGTIVERDSDGLQWKVTAVNYAGLSCTVAAHGNLGALSNDNAPVAYSIIADAGSDYYSTHQPKSTTTDLRFVGTQIHEETFQAPETWLNTPFVDISDKLKDQLNIIVETMRTKIARSCIRMSPTYDTGAYVTGASVEAPTMTGLCHWPRITQAESANIEVYRNKATVELYMEDLDNLIYGMAATEGADFNEKGWYLCHHPIQSKTIGDLLANNRRLWRDDHIVGYSTNKYESKNGAIIDLMPDPIMPKGMIICTNLPSVEWGFYKNDDIHVKDLPQQSRTIMRLISCQTYGVIIRKLRANLGTIYGLPTT